MKIIPYNEKYREDVKQVCVNTGPAEASTDRKMYDYITNMYCNYYIDNEIDNIFVLTDESDKAQGYIFCAADFRKYKKGMKKYFRIIRRTGFSNLKEGICEFTGTMIFSSKYPAHLHIDINYDYNHMGYGTRLLNTLIDHLKTMSVPGVMLIVDAGNKEAISFYKKNNFRNLLKSRSALIMGMKL